MDLSFSNAKNFVIMNRTDVTIKFGVTGTAKKIYQHNSVVVKVYTSQ